MNSEILESIRKTGKYIIPIDVNIELIETQVNYLINNGYLREYTMNYVDNIIYGKCR